jgi:hypothetical protein
VLAGSCSGQVSIPGRSTKLRAFCAGEKTMASQTEHASIPVTIICLSGILMILVGELYYAFIGPHPDASGSIQEDVLNSLFWSDHPGITWIALGLILFTVGYIIDRRSRTGGNSQPQEKRESTQKKAASANESKSI